jgi:hypothetical protein
MRATGKLYDAFRDGAQSLTMVWVITLAAGLDATSRFRSAEHSGYLPTMLSGMACE